MQGGMVVIHTRPDHFPKDVYTMLHSKNTGLYIRLSEKISSN